MSLDLTPAAVRRVLDQRSPRVSDDYTDPTVQPYWREAPRHG